MAQIMTTCPVTGGAVWTRQHATDSEWVERASLSCSEGGGGTFRCTECSQMHQWARSSAWLRAAHAPSPFGP